MDGLMGWMVGGLAGEFSGGLLGWLGWLGDVLAGKGKVVHVDGVERTRSFSLWLQSLLLLGKPGFKIARLIRIVLGRYIGVTCFSVVA